MYVQLDFWSANARTFDMRDTNTCSSKHNLLKLTHLFNLVNCNLVITHESGHSIRNLFMPSSWFTWYLVEGRLCQIYWWWYRCTMHRAVRDFGKCSKGTTYTSTGHWDRSHCHIWQCRRLQDFASTPLRWLCFFTAVLISVDVFKILHCVPLFVTNTQK